MAVSSPADVLIESARALGEDGRLVLCHIIRCEGSTPGKPGWRLAVLGDGRAVGNLGGGAFEAMVATDAKAKLDDPQASSEIKRYYFTEKAVRGEATGMVCGGLSEVFLEVMQAPPVLVICGGGPVGQALAQAGDLAGFEPLLVEDRAEFRRPELFPASTRFAEVERDFRGDYLAGCSGRDLYVTVVSRCWDTDVAALVAVLEQDPQRLAYLGLLGSRRKVERVRREVATRGHDLTARDFKGPIGLPVGGDSPGEIAISILAEILAVRHGNEAAVRGGLVAAEPPAAAVEDGVRDAVAEA